MTDVTIRLTDSPVALALTGTRADGADDVSVTHVRIRTTVAGSEVTADLSLEDKISVPIVVLSGDGNDYGLKSPSQADDVSAAGALAKLRRTLAERPITIAGNEFFGLPTEKMSVRGRLSITVPESGKITMAAEASQVIDADIQLANFATATVSGRLTFTVQVTEDDVLAAIDMILPKAPELGFSLPHFKLPKLSFADLKVELPAMTALKLPVPDWLPDELIKVSGGKPFALAITDDGLTITAGSPINILVTGENAITVTDFVIAQAGKDISVTGSVSANADISIDQSFPFGGAGFPIRGGLHVKTASFKTDGTNFAITWSMSRLWIEATNDPDTRIAVAFELTSTTTIANGETKWGLAKLQILDLGGGELLKPEIGSINARIRIHFGALWSKAEPFLRRLLRLIGGVAQWMGETLGPIPGLLAELAENVGILLAEAPLAILEKINNAESFVTLEFRLDAASFRPVQLIVTVNGVDADVTKFEIGGSFLMLDSDLSMKPALILDFEHNWQGLAFLSDTNIPPHATVSTNLWMEADADKSSSIPQLKKEQETKPLIAVTATMKTESNIVLAALQHGQAKFFQKFEGERGDSVYEQIDGNLYALGTVGTLTGLNDLASKDVDITFQADSLKEKLLALMPQGPEIGGGALDELGQYVKIGEVGKSVKFPNVELTLPIEIIVAEMKVPVTLKLSLNIYTLHMKLEAAEEVFIEGEFDASLFGLKLVGKPKGNRMFRLSFKDGDATLSLAEGASIDVIFDQLSGSGSGLMLTATEFGIGRGGLDLTARTTDRPVRLAGLDQPFRFTNGSLVVKGGQLQGGTISGHGPMPPALIGEANAEIDIVFGRRNGRLAVIAANAKLEKEGEPLYSTGTKFKVTLDALGLAFREPEFGPVQFFFQLWGSASFEPAPGEFDGGLLKNIRSVAIKLDGAPLAGDGRELIKHISFLVELDPPLRESLFDIFGFELRGIAFYPASKAWPDTPPAIGLAGQVSFLEAGDVVSSEISFHELLLAPPEPGGSIPLPRIRADGLSVLLRVGGIAQVEATAVAVDGSIPTIYAPVELPANVTADGFLASGRVSISGLGAFGGAMGFLELRKEGVDRVKHAMFLYGQAEKLSERIDTPIGPLFIREAGFGFGKNYTLTAMAAADGARSPRELVKVLDEVSKLQGNLTNFNAWTPQYDKDAITIALRGMISLTTASADSASYDAESEKNLANPLLMDIVLGLRSDFTFFANVRGWLAYNYNDWFTGSSTNSFKERPTLRGYLYFSVPRKELLARFLSDPTGMIGEHPKLDDNLVKAIQSTRFAATLYIRPGLYHCEFGWPYELGFEMGDRDGNFHLDVAGGLVLRIEDATMLYGLAFKAAGHMEFGGSVGNANFGASAVARADFLLGAKFIAYITPLNPKDTLFYGEIYLNLSLRIGVNIWMSFKIFKKRFTLHISFSIGLTISVSAEVVLSGQGVGAQVHAAVGVSGFGRTLSVGVGFAFGASQLAAARARVARFMDLGLGIDPPKENALAAPGPAQEIKRENRAAASDERLDKVVPQLPANEQPAPNEAEKHEGERIGATHFWAMLFLGGKDDAGEDSYLMMLVPRDRSDENDAASTFYAEPFEVEHDETGGKGVFHTRNGEHDYTLDVEPEWSGIRHLRRGDKGFTSSPLATGENMLEASLDLEVGQSEFGPLDLNALMAECFLYPPLVKPDEGHLIYGEPLAISHAMPSREGQKTARDQRVSQASRNIATGALEASLVAEEKRSALITKAGESAFAMAEEARRRVGMELKEKWRLDADAELAAPDFGLTFIVTDEQIKGGDLFAEIPLTLKKRIWNGKVWTTTQGNVTLLNHPKDAFDHKQPRLDDARVKVDQDGFKLLWDLEPAFGASGDISFARDPETLLAHYRIERSFEGAVTTWRADFLTRTATPLKYEKNGEKISTTRSRARMHLCDDFSIGGVPEDLRALLIGAPIPSGRSPTEVWSDAFGNNVEASVVYKVVAVDIMGTETGQRVLERPLTRPAMRAPAPLNAEMLVEYRDGLGGLGDTIPAPHIELAVDFVDEKAWNAAPKSIYQLRIRSHALRGGGQYGADALDDSQNRPGQADIENFREGKDRDLFIVRLEGGGGLPFVRNIAPKGENEIAKKPELPFSFGVFDSLEAAKAVTKQTRQTEEAAREVIARALQVPMASTPADHLRASRVFLRNLGNKENIPHEAKLSGQWLITQTQLLVPPVQPQEKSLTETAEIKPETYSATVELLETPVTVPFLALRQEQIVRSAGRLELVFPDAKASFGDFVGQSRNNLTLRRLDPDLRSAIRLDFNASGSRVATSDHSSLNGLVAGYDIFAASPARLRMRGDKEIGVTTATVVEEAHKRATVKVLPRSLAGLFPDKLPDFRSIDVRYPSETLRTDPQMRGNRPRARWYSNAESLVAFPAHRLRLSLFPVTDEKLISSLLDEFRATKITVSLSPPTTVPPDWDQDKWSKLFKINTKSDLALQSLSEPEENTPERREDGEIILASDAANGVKASELRAMLRGLVLKENTKLTAAYRKWRRNGSDPNYANAFKVRVEITAQDGMNEPTKMERAEVNLASTLHPVIADTLDTLCYKQVTNGTAGLVYRAYEVEMEPVPPQETKGFDALLDGNGPSGDPYGWSALRALGLAAGFRVYDIDNGRFISGRPLFEHVNACFTAALKRYHHKGADLGHPFVELVDMPETFMDISSMDDRSDHNQKDADRIINSNTAILQIGLRPRAAQQHGTGEVQYLVVKVADTSKFQNEKDEDKENPRIQFPEGFIFDAVGLPNASDQGATRFVADGTAKLVFPNQQGLPAEATLDLKRLKGLKNDDTCFVLRATRIDRNTSFDIPSAEMKKLEAIGLVVEGWHAHPAKDNTPSFETFSALDPVLLAFLQGRRDENHALTPLETLLEWLPTDHLPQADNFIGNAPDRNTLDALLPLVIRFSEWTARFLPNGAAQAEPDSAAPPAISFAFAALTSEEGFARVPDAAGRVSAFFIDPARLGREYYFAIRPFGRYAAIETMLYGHSERPVTLEGGLPDDWQNHFAAVSLDRTKPPEPPAILAARPSGQSSRNNAAGIELIVARTPDQIASEANLDAERALQGGWTGLELRAHYPATDLARTLLRTADFDPFAAFAETNFKPASEDPKTHVQIFTPDDLANMRQAAPDAWRGSVRFDLSGLPHFFDTVALVHQSAGAVVSDISAAPLPRSGRTPNFPPFNEGTSETDTPLNKIWGIADAAVWSVAHEKNKDVNLTPRITFDLPMMRNLDLMPPEDLLAWTNNEVPKEVSVFSLPDLSASYRISTDAPDYTSTVPQIDLLPARTAEKVKDMYSAILTGDRFVTVAHDTLEVVEQPKSKNRLWRLKISVDMLGTVPDMSPPEMPEIEFDETAEFTDLPDAFNAALWAAWAPVRSFVFTVLTPDNDAIDALVAELQPFSDAPSVGALIADLQSPDLKPLDQVKGRLPLGLAIPELSEVLSADPPEVGPFGWPDSLTDLGLSDADANQYTEYAASLDEEARIKAVKLLEDMRTRWQNVRDLKPMDIGPVYRATDTKEPQTDLAPPFAHFRMVRYSKISGKISADNRQELIDTIQTLSDVDRFVQGKAVRLLREVSVDSVIDVTLPLPVGTDAPEVEELDSTEIGETFVGVHWLPDTQTLSELDEANPLRSELFQIVREMIFGKGVRVKLTGFAGSDGAKSVDIHQKGEPS